MPDLTDPTVHPALPDEETPVAAAQTLRNLARVLGQLADDLEATPRFAYGTAPEACRNLAYYRRVDWFLGFTNLDDAVAIVEAAFEA